MSDASATVAVATRWAPPTRRAGAGHAAGSATATKPATQKLPEACPLGNDPSCGAPIGAARPIAIHGRTRPTASLTPHTHMAWATTASVSGVANRRVRDHPMSGSSASAHHPLPRQLSAIIAGPHVP